MDAEPQPDRKPKMAKLTLAARTALARFPWPTVSLALTLLALLYALLAGLHTVFDMDMGWHLATGRWVAQHHAVPSTDVLSYTSPGAEWLYPPFAGWLLYGVFSAWGYAGLTWFCALVLMATTACLLRSSRDGQRLEAGLAAGLAILAVPLLAGRASPRADLFTPLLFVIFLARLWRFHRTDPTDAQSIRRQRRLLWILPLSMVLWVNLHPGFIAGLGLILAYHAIEGLDSLSAPEQRAAVAQRLRLAWPVLAATVFATLINPYGPRILKASFQLAGLAGAGPQTDRAVVEELAPVPLALTTVLQSLDWRGPNTFWWLAFAAVAVIAVALRRGQFGAALLIAAALLGSLEHRRYIALFAIALVVIGPTILAEALQRRGPPTAAPWSVRRSALAALATGALLLVTCVRIADLVSSHLYIVANTPMQFGAGESWWYPERAAQFIRTQRLPGNIFQLYNLGGFTAWRLGPEYRDFIDGRNLSHAVLIEEHDLLTSAPDSATWIAEADKRGINILFLSLARFSGVGSPNLLSLCQSAEWRPVYMDEVALVLLRNRTENQPWIGRYAIDCRTQAFAPPPAASSLQLANFYANAGDILLNLGRLSEAQEALTRAESLSSDDPSVHFALGQLFEVENQPEDAEEEYKTTLSLAEEPELALLCLGRFYYAQGRLAEARPLILHASELSTMPASDLSLLGAIDLRLGQTDRALSEFARAESVGKEYLEGGEDKNPAFFAQIAEGRAAAYFQLGQTQRAIEFQQLATKKTPENAGAWKSLGDLYDKAGEAQLADRAYRRASALAK